MNKIRKQTIKSFSVVFLLCVGVAFARSDENVIAKVNGHVIRSSDIAVPSDLVAKNVQPDADAVRQAALKRQEQKLRNQIRKIVFDDAVKRYGISVTEDEITARVNKSFSDVDITEDTATRIRGKGLRIADCLRKVVVNRADPDDIYSTDLEDLITQREWDAYLSNYDTSAKIDSLIKSLPRNVADMKANSRASTRNDLEAERLEQRICSDISVTDADLASYCQQRLQKNPKEISPELREKIEKRILVDRQSEAKRMWWKKQISEADVEILDSRFEGIKNAIMNDLSVDEDPRKRFSRTSRVPLKATGTKQKNGQQ